MIGSRSHLRSAFTLLELILTLAMSVVLMVLVGGAIQFYGRDMNIRDMDIRQTQLAAALMQMIEDDLRATMHGEPADMAALEALLTSSTGGQGESQEDLSAAGIDSEDDSAMLPADTTADLSTTAAVLVTPGLIGNQTSIQIDLSHLPRLEEYQQMMDENAANLEDVPSDLKTVAYFVQAAGTIGGVQDKLLAMGEVDAVDDASAGGGLVRRSLDRSATAYAASTGGLSMLNQSGDLLAPEVSAIEFEYWDGVTWLLEWSSDEYGELPMAVKVSLTMADATNPDEPTARVFSHVVRLPMAKPIDDSEEDELTEAGL